MEEAADGNLEAVDWEAVMEEAADGSPAAVEVAGAAVVADGTAAVAAVDGGRKQPNCLRHIKPTFVISTKLFTNFECT